MTRLKWIFAILFTLLILNGLTAQESDDSIYGSNIKRPLLFITYDKFPQFPGGYEALKEYLTSEMTYPANAMHSNIQGTVYVGYLITKTGKVDSVYVMRGANPELDKEAYRVVRALPDFIPAMSGGKPISVWQILPINFKLHGEKNKDKK